MHDTVNDSSTLATRADRSAPKGEGAKPTKQGASPLVIAIGVSLLLGWAPEQTFAKPAYKKQAAAYYGSFLPRKLAKCALCHLTDDEVDALGDKLDPDLENPWNAYGLTLKALGDQAKQLGKKLMIVRRIKTVADRDADGDGVSNQLELLLGFDPGRKQSAPDKAQLADAKKIIIAFGKRYIWSPFDPVKQPAIPKLKNTQWVRNPIDAFVSAKHNQFGLTPRPEAPRHVLLRRVYLDLIGLPPTPKQLRDFLLDHSSDAYQKVVDQLLKSPHYGERWGRHWMDIWRYADQDKHRVPEGLEIAPHMWRWRDWIIDSLNSDRGYDVMVQQMLAGDEIAPNDPQTVRATAYLGRNKSKSRDAWLHQTVDHLMQGFVGLSIQCARCHDHPVEAISQIEYYQLRAIFEPYNLRTDKTPGSKDAKKDGMTRAYDANTGALTYLYIRGNVLRPQKDRPLKPGVPSLLRGSEFTIEKLERSTGRRKALAMWITDRSNPLSARVAINHIWKRHFGQALIATLNDLGSGGAAPTHPQLLDWLADDFMAGDWKMKRLHRLIVTSNTYRMSSTPDAASEKIDPDNRYLWRVAPRRIEAELVRDMLLYVSGRLDQSMGGPELDPDENVSIRRRSLYFRTSPYSQMTFLMTFDGAAIQECYERAESVQPQQALALLNSSLAQENARLLGRSLASQAKNDQVKFVRVAFQAVLSRNPSEKERAICLEFLKQQIELLSKSADANRHATSDLDDGSRPSKDPALRARENLVHLLFNHHDFVTIK